MLNSHRQKNTEITQVGIILDHLYSKGTLSAERLKGKDNNLYYIFSSSSLFQISLRPIAVNFEGQLQDRYKGDSGSDSGSYIVVKY